MSLSSRKFLVKIAEYVALFHLLACGIVTVWARFDASVAIRAHDFSLLGFVVTFFAFWIMVMLSGEFASVNGLNSGQSDGEQGGLSRDEALFLVKWAPMPARWTFLLFPFLFGYAYFNQQPEGVTGAVTSAQALASLLGPAAFTSLAYPVLASVARMPGALAENCMRQPRDVTK